MRQAHDFVVTPKDQLVIATSGNRNWPGLLQLWDRKSGEFLGSFAPGDELGNATGLALGPDGLLYVADYRDHRVVRYDLTKLERIDTFISAEQGVFHPVSVEFTASGLLYLIDDRGIVRYDSEGRLIDVLIPAGRGPLSRPRSMAFVDPELQ